MKSFVFRKELNGVDAYTRHKRLLKSYATYSQNSTKQSGSTTTANPEHAILRKHHKFIQSLDDDPITWEQRLAKKYYDQLFKEYALCELTYYKQGKIALRWRTEDEVVMGKGQFICASTKCDVISNLTSWEVNFGYMEDGIKKNELVKVRLCIDCSKKLNYKTQKKQRRQQQQVKMDTKRNKRHHRDDTDNSDAADDDDDKNEPNRKKNKKSKTEATQHDSADDDDTSRKRKDQDPSSIWSKDLTDTGDKTKEEEFEDYFADLLQ